VHQEGPVEHFSKLKSKRTVASNSVLFAYNDGESRIKSSGE